MRTRLLDAIMAVYAADGRGERAVIDDVVGQAGVSRGTFYKYFNTLEAAVVAVGQRNADDMMQALADVFGAADDPLRKAVGGPLLALARAAMDPHWASFTARVDYVERLSRPAPLYAVVGDSLEGARAAGALHFTSLVAAVDIAVGATVQATRRLAHHTERHLAYVVDVAVMILLALGMERTAAQAAAREAWAQILLAAPRLPWWRPLDDGG
jgi:AcrR family transcriptional regulator